MFWPPEHMMSYGWGGWLAGGLMMLLFWGGLIALIFFLIRAASSDGRKPEDTYSGENAKEIVKRRYARGEISKAEYDAIRRDIET